MIKYKVECRMLTAKGKTVTRTTSVNAKTHDEARAKARRVYQMRGNNAVESLAAYVN